jgi:hypothetical protein
MNRTPIPLIIPALPSCGPMTLACVCVVDSMTSQLSMDNRVAPKTTQTPGRVSRFIEH